MSFNQDVGAWASSDTRWLRLAWYPLYAVALGIFLAAIPAAVIVGPRGFTEPRFAINPSPVVRLLNLTTIGAAATTAIVSLALAALLYRKSAGDRMALILAYFLPVYGVLMGGPLESLEAFVPGFSRITTTFIIPLFVPFILALFAIFPDGRFVPRWIRWAVLAIFLLTPLSLFWTTLFSFSTLDFSNPITLILMGSITLFGISAWMSLLYAQIFRYRNVSSPQQRQQTKWVAYGIGIFLTVQLLGSIPWTYSYTLPTGTMFPWWMAAVAPVYLLSIAILPVTLSIAVLRYRLFEIDFLINRSLVYGALTAVIVGIYILVVGAFGTFFQSQGNLMIALLATGLVAVLFQPLRARLQRVINRIIFGERDDPIEALSRLGSRLETTLTPDAVLPTLVETIAQTLKIPYVAIHLPASDGERVAASHGKLVGEPAWFPLVHQGQAIGQLVVASRSPGEAFSPAEARLLENVARQAGAAVHAAHLSVDLQRSRQKLVSAREEERRRLRRDLHDGLGPTLAALHVQSNALRRMIREDPAAAETMADEFKAEIREAIGDIRRVVYELRPPTLDDLGLLAATRAYAAQCSLESEPEGGISIDVDAPDELPALPAAVEVAAYHIIREALTNIVRHSRASRGTVRLSVNETFNVAVVDDGAGLPPKNNAGVGLLSMRERAEELGGTLTISQAPGGGTQVTAQLPLVEG